VPSAIPLIRSTDTAAVDALLSPRRAGDAAADRAAARIVEAVRRDGDAAVERFAREFDRARPPFEVPRPQWKRLARQAPADVRRAMATAAANIARVAEAQLAKPFRARIAPGITVEQRVTPLDRVGCYVPGGRYPLPSSLLMTAIPARVAGVREIIVTCPSPDPVIFAAAEIAGATRLFRLGGAHAVAALAIGTKTIPRVDRVVGPGNRYVAAAKRYISRECGIDMHAGPSEILILSSTGRPAWLAADLIAQAEHDPDARAVLITPRMNLALAVAAEVARQLPSTGPAAKALATNGGIIVSRSMREAIELANRMAPEHLVRVFRRFYRVDHGHGREARHGGAGLGLSIVEAVVTAHGGDVSARAVPGGGVSFLVRLPLGQSGVQVRAGVAGLPEPVKPNDADASTARSPL